MGENGGPWYGKRGEMAVWEQDNGGHSVPHSPAMAWALWYGGGGMGDTESVAWGKEGVGGHTGLLA